MGILERISTPLFAATRVPKRGIYSRRYPCICAVMSTLCDRFSDIMDVIYRILVLVNPRWLLRGITTPKNCGRM
ncbi:hypothetical protein DPMN_097354 [Dreissena polymorpha]|uniref:Uncharacterized protein n=1 Tax=Dreissena polymorpha TaxID=45954 RepID=A0A9D4R6B0_DREPO|nr:hypothetical protein DPMN_097354 [Dreissena polymorpha]